MTARDLELWAQFWQGSKNVFADHGNRIMCPWVHFPTGTPILDVWTWFDQQLSAGLLATIEAMQPTVTTTFSLTRREWEIAQTEPTIQFDMFGSDPDADWGESKRARKQHDGMKRLF